MNTRNARQNRFQLFAAIVAMAFAFTGCTKSIDLSLKLKAGDKRVVRTKSTNVMSMKMPGGDMSMDITQNNSIEYAFAVDSVGEDGVAVIKVTCKDVQFDMDMPGAGLMALGGADPTDKIETAMKGKTITLHLTQHGKVTDVEGLDEIEKAAKSTDPNKPAPLAAMESEMMKQIFGRDAVIHQFESLFSVYREEPTKKGDSWTESQSLGGGIALTIEVTYTVTDHADGTVTVESKATPSNVESTQQMGPMNVKTTFSGELSGTTEIDEATGWITNEESTATFEGSASMSGGMPGAFSMPMNLKATSSVETFAE